MSNEELAEWLEAEMKKRGWKNRELARKAGIAHSSVGRALNPYPDSLPGKKVLAAIARALRVPDEMVFRKAGVLSREPEHLTDHEMLIHVYEQLRRAGREGELMTYADYLLSTLRIVDDEPEED